MKLLIQFLVLLVVGSGAVYLIASNPPATTGASANLSVDLSANLSTDPSSKSESNMNSAENPTENPSQTNRKFPVQKSDAEWQKKLSPLAFEVTRNKGTERAFTGTYYDHHEAGNYTCACCGAAVFSSADKFESGSGWPSFTRIAPAGKVEEQVDSRHGMVRTEVHCSQCGGHLGHVFPDGPKPTGMRYCINSVSLGFERK